MARWVEPEDGAVIGWGEPIRGARLRNDGAGGPVAHQRGERWYPLDEDDVDLAAPWSWGEVESQIGDEPYRLVRGDPLVSPTEAATAYLDAVHQRQARMDMERVERVLRRRSGEPEPE